MHAWSLRRSELLTVTRQVAPLNYASRAKSAIVDCLVIIIVNTFIITFVFPKPRNTVASAALPTALQWYIDARPSREMSESVSGRDLKSLNRDS